MGKKGSGKKVFVGLSGGVDSAVSAVLLQKKGYDVTGVFIRIAIPGYPCTAGEDKVDAQRVAAHLRIPFIEIDLSKEYEKEVFRSSIEAFKNGTTPNPDTLCNQKIKFGAFFDFALSQGAEYVATGHYARIESDGEDIELLSGIDSDKDQSYFLWMVPEKALRQALFPVGHLHKPQVRALANQFGLPNARRKDSQGLCFLGDISIEDMLQRELQLHAGEVLDEHGAVVGQHKGAARYTLGQRHGFDLTVQTGEPHFVVDKDQLANTITVSTSPFPRDASKTHLTLTDTNWIGTVVDGTYTARYRYRQRLVTAELIKNNGTAQVVLWEPHYVPLGQSLVFYDGERCLGGGIISDTHLS